MNELMYSFRDNNVRVVMKNNEAWFVLKDVCHILEIGNPSDVVKRIPEKNLHLDTIEGSVGKRYGYLTNEYGIYEIIFTSRKKQAIEFKEWVFEEVLPSIRKRGVYATEDFTKKALEDPQFMIDALTALKKEREEKEKLELEKEINKPKVLLA